MKTRCRPGDLAIITRDELGYEENIGRIVEVHDPRVRFRNTALSGSSSR